MIKIGDLVKFANGNPKEQTLGIVLPPVEGMERHWTNTDANDMVNIFWNADIGIMPYRKDYLEVVK
tara:strand:+ start:480 stop:677 length:198 start_codon:yes stop_codon:yes gene_type:complete